MFKSKTKVIKRNVVLVLIIGMFIHGCRMVTNNKYNFLEYSENFLTMDGEPIDFSELPEPVELYSNMGANGMERILDYGMVEVVLMGYYDGQNIIETIYKDEKFVTSEGVHVGLSKEDTLAAYNKYDIKEFAIEKLVDFNVRSSIVKLDEYKNNNPFLYVDNSRIFDASYKGTDYWGGLGAYIFIFDNFDKVVKIILVAPTSG